MSGGGILTGEDDHHQDRDSPSQGILTIETTKLSSVIYYTNYGIDRIDRSVWSVVVDQLKLSCWTDPVINKVPPVSACDDMKGICNRSTVGPNEINL